jgi:hypothetical protein
VIAGEPLVDGPSADAAVTPSLTIEVTPFLSASAILTVKWTVILPPVPGTPFGTVSPDHVTTPLANVPPLSADPAT